MNALNEQVSKSYEREKKIETQLRRIETLLRSHENQNERWRSLVGKVVGELKELGDVNNWVEFMSRDMCEVERLVNSKIEKTKAQGGKNK